MDSRKRMEMGENKEVITCRVRVYGIVQGVGFRPAVSRLARTMGIRGSVCNKGAYVEVIAQGSRKDVSDFILKMKTRPPVRASVIGTEVKEIAGAPVYRDFSIVESAGSRGEIFISPDIAVCDDCARELLDPKNRRYLHPFINCTACGPRLTILDALPYDRERTSMKKFPMCPACAAEYRNPASRRYDAQPVCCNDCGPRVRLFEKEGSVLLREQNMHSSDSADGTGHPDTAACRNEGLDTAACRNECLKTPDCENGNGETAACEIEKEKLFADEAAGGRKNQWKQTLADGAAISRVREIIMDGGIAAVKGIGGFHLCCDAHSETAVRRLRRAKARPEKPFAVMFRDAETAGQECVIEDGQMEILTGHQKPILLLQRKDMGAGAVDIMEYGSEGADDSRENGRETTHDANHKTRTGISAAFNAPAGHRRMLADAVAPGNPKVGVMLPYAPIQILLFSYPDGIRMTDALVMTSGNAGGAPICKDEEEAMEELFSCADVILSNNRPINIRCDDSVMDFYRGRPYMIRRSRGYSPLPVRISFAGTIFKKIDDGSRTPAYRRCVLAIGGELKNTFCVGIGDLLYLSPYVGDLTDVRTEDALRDAVRRFLHLLAARPEAVLSDTHPAYRSVGIAETIAEKLHVPLIKVQHHYAHILSCMAENDYPGPVLGVSMDGTGYGEDGTIWGGEILLADTHSFRRLAGIMPFLQPGGDAAAQEGWRIAGAMICALTAASSGGKKFGSPPENTGAIHNEEQRTPDGNGAARQSAGQNAASMHPGSAGEQDISECTPEKVMEKLGLCGPETARILTAQCRGRINTVKSTSCGRIFDAAAAILGICLRSTYEGEAANKLMFAAIKYEQKRTARNRAEGVPSGREFPLHGSCAAEIPKKEAAESENIGSENEHTPSVKSGEFKSMETKDPISSCLNKEGVLRMRTDLIIRELIERRLAGENADYLAWLFHFRLACAIRACLVQLRTCGSAGQGSYEKAAAKTGAETDGRRGTAPSGTTGDTVQIPSVVCLTGGCFQNTLLLEMTETLLEKAGFRVLTHALVPPNDGGIALGQAAFGLAKTF